MAAYNVERELGEGEKILWHGKPKQGIVFRPIDIFLIPFTIFWFGFAIIWELAAGVGMLINRSSASIEFLIFGVPFLLIGFYITIGRFLVDKKQRSKTSYVVTNQRIIIISGLISRNVSSLHLRSLPAVTLSEKADGSGNLIFGESPYPFFFRSSGLGMHGMSGVMVFEGVADVRGVEAIIRKAQNQVI